MNKLSAIYLGDGAYVEWNGCAYVLFTSNGIARTNEIYLEPAHLSTLTKFAAQISSSKDHPHD